MYLPPTNNTEMSLTDYMEDPYLQYVITVQALHNGMVSPGSSKTFTPWTDSKMAFILGMMVCGLAGWDPVQFY